MRDNLQNRTPSGMNAQLSRRELLKRSAFLGIAGIAVGSLLAACAEDTADDDSPPAVEPDDDDVTEDEEPEPDDEVDDEEPAVPEGGSMTVGIHVDASQLDPHMTSSAQEVLIFYQIFNRLTRRDEDGEIVPELALEWDVAEDGESITFHLREGVQFHDGTEMDAEAVRWNFERILDPDTGAVIRGFVRSIDSIEVVSDGEIRFDLLQPDATLLGSLAHGSIAVISPTAYEESGVDFASQPVGSGPFRFADWVRDDHITVERFDDFWEEGVPYLDEIIFRPIPDASVRYTNLRTGDIDFNFAVEPLDVQAVEEDDELEISNIPNPGHVGVRLNVTHEPFTDKLVRQAIAWAVDRDQINEILFAGQFTPAYGVYDPSTWAYDPDFHPYSPRDVEHAQELLTEAGHEDGISFSVVFASSPQTEQAVELLQAQLAEANIDVTPQAVDRGVFLDGIVDREWSAYWDGIGAREDPHTFFAEHFACDQPYNGQDYCNEEMDALLQEAISIYDQEERLPIYRQIEEMIVEDSPMVFLYHGSLLRAWNRRVSGVSINPVGRIFFWWTQIDQG